MAVRLAQQPGSTRLVADHFRLRSGIRHDGTLLPSAPPDSAGYRIVHVPCRLSMACMIRDRPALGLSYFPHHLWLFRFSRTALSWLSQYDFPDHCRCHGRPSREQASMASATKTLGKRLPTSYFRHDQERHSSPASSPWPACADMKLLAVAMVIGVMESLTSPPAGSSYKTTVPFWPI